MRPTEVLRGLVEGKLELPEDGLGFVRPSTLSQGCLLAVWHELLGHPRAEPGARRRRIMQAGNAAHERIMGYLRPVLLARELPFLEPELRIRGRCDALLNIPSSLGGEHAGFYVLEVKTTGSLGFSEIRASGEPKVEHLRQCLIYMRGIQGFYGIPVRGGLIYYEDRDTLAYKVFQVEYDEEPLRELLELLPEVIALARRGEEPKNPAFRLPPDHWAHRYCPYLPICPYGKEAVAASPRELPEAVKARIIAQGILNKRNKGTSKKRKGLRSLEELAREFGWE